MIIEYFKTVSIVISNVKFEDKGTEQFCNACFCWTGKRIIAKVDLSDLDVTKEYGFQELK